MRIKHQPVFKTAQVEALYSEEDGVPVKYVCTTEFGGGDIRLADIFYRETPHPEFGNKYFALFYHGEDVMIANADQVENMTFGMVFNDDNELEYSRYRHEYKQFNNGNMIDGGRAYIRSAGKTLVFQVRDGEMVNYSPVPLTDF